MTHVMPLSGGGAYVPKVESLVQLTDLHKRVGRTSGEAVTLWHMHEAQSCCRLPGPMTITTTERNGAAVLRFSDPLWHCDLKLVPPGWLIGILDDHSRFVPGSERFDERRMRSGYSTGRITSTVNPERP